MLSLCLCLSATLLRKLGRDFVGIFGAAGRGPRNCHLDFSGDLCIMIYVQEFLKITLTSAQIFLTSCLASGC